MASPMPIPFSLVDTKASNILSAPSSGSPWPLIDKLCQYSASIGVPNSNTQERLSVDILHRVDRIGDQIDDDLLNLISIHENLKDRVLEFVLDRRRPPAGILLQERNYLPKKFHHVA
jgi:hypothetical protein